MTTYVPLRQRPIVAVRLKSDLMAAKGDWIGIDSEENTIIHLSNEQFLALYGRREQPLRKQQLPRKAPKVLNTSSPDLFARQADSVTPVAIPIVTKRTNRTADSMLASQLGRVFYHLRRSARPVTLRELIMIIDGAENQKSVSAGLSSLKELDLVRYEVRASSRSGLWSVTDRGCVVFDRLGPVCFTKYNLQVPPDTLPATLAEKFAVGWKDHHNP